jgi:hypothetical protein
MQDLFLLGFSYVLQIDMHFICTPMWTKFYSCKKWVLQGNRERDSNYHSHGDSSSQPHTQCPIGAPEGEPAL